MSSLISSVAWVKRGASAQHPKKYVLDDTELERVSALARIELEDARTELARAHEAAQQMGKDVEDDAGEEDEEDAWVDEEDDPMAMDEDPPAQKAKDDLSQYNLDDYDDDDGPTPAVGPFSNIKGLQYYQSNNDDPYITLKEDDEDDERGELEVYPSDNMLVTAKTEEEVSQLEVYVYDESTENLYVHHDLLLPNFPLCLEWLDFPPSTSDSTPSAAGALGNYIAVGTLDPEIEIWSLDVVEGLYPDAVLGRADKTAAHVPAPLGTGKKKRKKAKHRAADAAHHVDAVLALSWNRTHRNLLASASADRTVKLWDLSRCSPGGEGDAGGAGAAIRSFDVHRDKVQAVQWNEKEPTVLLTGSYDRTVRTFDSRAPDAGVGALVGADVEALRWDPWEPHSFYVSLENGMVLNFDARTLPTDVAGSPSPARFTLQAHDGAVSALDVNPHMRGCIATGGTDKMVKVWNVNEEGGKMNVSLVTSRDLGVGKVFSTVWSPDDPLTLAAAGSKAKLQIWDVSANFGARKAFGPKLAKAGREVKEKTGGGLIGVVDDDEGSGGDDDE